MRVLVAPDKFKGTLSAESAAQSMALGIQDADPTAEVDICPVADGGEGSHEVVVVAGFDEHPVDVRRADGEIHRTSIAVRSGTAVLELARICGAPTLQAGPRPWTSHTAGLGQAILAAVAHGVDEVVLCIGGSASVDGGTGMLAALGFELRAANGAVVRPGLGGLGTIERVVPPRRPLSARFTVVCDVSTPLLGERGGIRMFSRQKGLDAEEVLEAERRAAQWAHTTMRSLGRDLTGAPGGGSAGGVGFAAIAYLGAHFRQGLDYFDHLIGLSARIASADVVFTGEGAFDAGSLEGKTPTGVGRRALAAGRPCLLVAGSVHVRPNDTHLFADCWSLTDEVGPAQAMDDAATALRETTARAFRVWRRNL